MFFVHCKFPDANVSWHKVLSETAVFSLRALFTHNLLRLCVYLLAYAAMQ